MLTIPSHFFIFVLEMKYLQNKYVFLYCIIASVLLYAVTFNFGINLDDNLIIEHLPDNKLGWIEGVKSIFSSKFNKNDYRPILILSYFLESYLSNPLNPNTSHIINALLYGVSGFITFLFVKKLPFINDKKIALLIALLFILLPLHTNVVCNLKSRDNILSYLFGISALYFWCKVLYDKKYLNIVSAAMLTLIASLAKLDAIVFLAMPVLLWWYVKEQTTIKIKYFIPFLLGVVIFYLNVRDSLVAISNPNNVTVVVKNFYNENPLMTDMDLSKFNALGTSFAYYIKFLVLPIQYYFYFGHKKIDITNFYTPENVIGYLFLFVAIALSIYYFIKKEKWGFCLAWVLLALFPFLNFMTPVAGIVADRHAYIASLGFCIFLGLAIDFFCNKYKIKLLYMVLPLFLMYSYLSYSRAKDWKDILTLVEADMPYLQNSYDANRIASTNYLKASQEILDNNQKNIYLDKAVFYAQQGLSTFNDETILKNILGKIYFFKNDYMNSSNYLYSSLKIDSTNIETWILLGDLNILNQKYLEAASFYQNAYHLNPSVLDLEYKVVDAYCNAKQYSKADSINNVIAKKPSQKYIPIENKGYIAIYQGDTLKAYTYLTEAIKLGLVDNELKNKIQEFSQRKKIVF
jgi:hypothetical protein